MKDKAVKRYVIGNIIELIKTEKANIILFHEEATHINYYEWKIKNIGLIKNFFKS